MSDAMKKTAGHLFEGVIEGLVMSFFTTARKTVEEKGEEFLKAKFGNRGTNDEYLFLDACTLALENKLISEKELLRVMSVIDNYSSSQRARIIGIIGKMESERTIERIHLKEKITLKGNYKGADMLGMLGKMSDAQIKKFFKASGVSVTATSELKKSISKTTKRIKKSELKSDCDSFLKRETWLEKFAKSL